MAEMVQLLPIFKCFPILILQDDHSQEEGNQQHRRGQQVNAKLYIDGKEVDGFFPLPSASSIDKGKKFIFANANGNRCQFHQCSMSSFCASRFKLTLLAAQHRVYRVKVRRNFLLSVLVKLGIVLLVK